MWRYTDGKLGMKGIDARGQSRDELYARRMQVIHLMEQGLPVMRIVERTGLSWAAVDAAIMKYRVGGASALMPAARGRKRGTGRALTEEQETAACRFIRMRRPQFYGLKKSLWDRETVKQLIAQKFSIDLSERLVRNYLKRWGVTLKDSKRKEYDRCSRDVQRWLDINYNELAQRAEAERAEIYWLRKPFHIDAGRWYSIESSSSEAANQVTPKKLWVAAAVTSQGALRWRIGKGRFNSKRQAQFVEALLRDAKKKVVFLIRTDPKSYASEEASEELNSWLQNNGCRVRIFPDPFGERT